MPKAKNILHATRVDRIAIVDRPAVPDAQIVIFKRQEGGIEKGAISFQDLPIADVKAGWDADAALKAIKAYAGGDNIDWAKYRKAFMWHDKNAETEGAYKLPCADVVNGELVIVPKAIFAIVGAVAGARSGINIPQEDKKKVLSNCKKYYKKMDKEFPEVAEKCLEISIEKDFNAGFLFRGTEAACDALQNECWNAIYADGGDGLKAVSAAFTDFTNVVLNILAKVTLIKNDAGQSKLTEDDIVKPFARGLEITVMSEAFSYFKMNLAYLVADNTRLENPETMLKKIIGMFQDFVVKSLTNIVANKRDGEVAFEKIGRAISAARLSKLRQLIDVLAELVGEAETNTDKVNKEGAVEMKELIEKFEKLSGVVETLVSQMTVISGVIKDKGLTRTEAEQAAFDKKLALEKRASAVGLDVSASEDVIVKMEKAATDKADLEKRALAVGLPKEATAEAIDKKEKEVKDANEKSLKDAKEALEKRAEKAGLAKDSTLEAVEKKEKEDAGSRIDKIEKAVGEIGKVIGTFGKRFGVKTSIDADIIEDKNDKDTFGAAVRGK
jgi:hypothetical protein